MIASSLLSYVYLMVHINDKYKKYAILPSDLDLFH